MESLLSSGEQVSGVTTLSSSIHDSISYHYFKGSYATNHNVNVVTSTTITVTVKFKIRFKTLNLDPTAVKGQATTSRFSSVSVASLLRRALSVPRKLTARYTSEMFAKSNKVTQCFTTLVFTLPCFDLSSCDLV